MKNNKGFTLIELLVVVLIIGILAAIALPQYFKAVAKSRATEALMLTKNIKDAADRYFLANNSSFTGISTDLLDITVPETSTTYTYDLSSTRVLATPIDTSHGAYIKYDLEGGTKPGCYSADAGLCSSFGDAVEQLDSQPE